PMSDPPKPVLTLYGHADAVYAVTVSPDGRRAATGSFDKTVKLWDLSTGKELRTLAGPSGHQGLVLSVAFAPDGNRLASGGVDNAAKLWDPATGTVTATLAHPNHVDAVAFDKSGKLLATACHDGVVRVWDAAKGQGGKQINALLPPASTDRTVKHWPPATGTLAREFPNPALKPPVAGLPHPSHPGFVHAVRFTADGKRLVSAGPAPRNQGYLAVWSVADGKLL